MLAETKKHAEKKTRFDIRRGYETEGLSNHCIIGDDRMLSALRKIIKPQKKKGAR